MSKDCSGQLCVHKISYVVNIKNNLFLMRRFTTTEAIESACHASLVDVIESASEATESAPIMPH